MNFAWVKNCMLPVRVISAWLSACVSPSWAKFRLDNSWGLVPNGRRRKQLIQPCASHVSHYSLMVVPDIAPSVPVAIGCNMVVSALAGQQLSNIDKINNVNTDETLVGGAKISGWPFPPADRVRSAETDLVPLASKTSGSAEARGWISHRMVEAAVLISALSKSLGLVNWCRRKTLAGGGPKASALTIGVGRSPRRHGQKCVVRWFHLNRSVLWL